MTSYYTCMLTWHHIIPACWHGITLYLYVDMASHYTCLLTWHHIIPACSHGITLYLLVDMASYYTCMLRWHHIIPVCWHGITLYLHVDMASHYTCLLTWHHIIPACWHGITLYLPVCFVWWRDDGLIANCNLQPKPTKGNVSYVLTDNLSFPFNLEFVQDRTSFSELDRQCLLSVSTVSVYRQCVPSVSTVSVYRQCVPLVWCFIRSLFKDAFSFSVCTQSSVGVNSEW